MPKQHFPLTSLLIKPAGPDCNLNCRYCFYLGKSKLFPQQKKHRMGPEVLRETIRQGLQQCGKSICFSWQGGEPSLMGLGFYKSAVEWQKTFGAGKQVTNAFQTNGILLDYKWARFFARYSFLVGLSIDGPRHVHDHYRNDAGGRGTWQKVRDAADMLKEHGVAVNAMTCLTDYSSRFPEEIYQHHKQAGLDYMQFIPVFEPDPQNPKRPAGFSVTPQAYTSFMRRIFDLWQQDFVDGRPTTSVRLFDSIYLRLMGQPSAQCTFLKQCGDYLVIEHNGDIYPCDFFVEREWKLGSVLQNRLTDLLNSGKQAKFRRQKKQLPKSCKTCEHLKLCYGGCIKDRQFNPEHKSLNYLCRAYLDLFEYSIMIVAQSSQGISFSSRGRVIDP